MDITKLSLLKKSILSNNTKNIEQLALTKTIDITDNCLMSELPNFFHKQYKSQLGYKISPETKITLAHILASYNFSNTLIFLIEQEKLKHNFKFKDYKKIPTIGLDISKENNIEERILKNTIMAVNTLKHPINYANENIIQEINNYCGENNYNNANIKKYLLDCNLDGNLIFINGMKQMHTPSFMQFALTHDDINFFQYLLENNKTKNVSFFNILNTLKTSYTDKKPKLKAYPKKIVHHILDDYYNPFIQNTSISELNNKKNKTFKSLLISKSLEMIIIKAKDEQAFNKIAKNKQLYENTDIIEKISNRLLNGDDKESWLFLYKMIEKHNIKTRRHLLTIYFERPKILYKKSIFNELLKNSEFYNDFKKDCLNKEPNYQNDFSKIQYLLDNDINVDTTKIKNKVFAYIEKTKIEYNKFKDIKKNQKGQAPSLILDRRPLVFVAKTLNEIPNILSENEKQNFLDFYKKLLSEEQYITPSLKEQVKVNVSTFEHILLKDDISNNKPRNTRKLL